jgi:hypothetical protein
MSKGTPNSVGMVSLEFFDVELRPDGIVWLKRNSASYGEIVDVHRAYDQFLAVVDNWKLERRIASGHLGTRAQTPMAWLYDVRFAPTQRNDPKFEAVIVARRPDLLKRSPFLVILVKTAAGRMQLTRMAGSDKERVRISDDFSGSIEWLHEQLASTAPSRP